MTGRLRGHRTTLLITLGLLAAVAVVVWSGQGGRTAEDLDPANPGPAGARALARVLDDHGVDVSVARGADELDAADIDTATTVVVTSTDSLGRSTVERLLSTVGDARLVLVAPGPGVTDAMGLGGQPSSSTLGQGTRGACADPAYDALVLEVDATLAYPAADGCFRTDDGDAVLVERDGVVSFGAGDALTNDQILRGDNAAVALRLLGQDERLVWYVPSVADLVGDDGVSLASLLPDWLAPGLWLVGLSAVALVLWRVRRLGPLSTEPLPVVVKAIETTLSRGRLYRRAGDRAHAAGALRRAARTRAAERLRLGTVTDDQVLVRDVAQHLGRPIEEVAALLAPDAPTPASDAALITLADQLAELDREVRRT
ncbi:hypothetical protein NPS01_01970 [Nocardioides psychrotolerans]|uniref:DUF4350 domain-containing protein n=1 Tax=Nocardioides psychrotolerans TaxID=1005945 RepID=A0A1I3BNN9_9ACTN|nr:DUF4350 domain-containing protein [Nocardioides psychrotolerans]GEP36534.1 hypothetical protein NPS01_01970 [Nocardioides psychrotolerans]SFH63954.1 protein of unknown function [Nocardioides psychrotolerans]